MNSVFWLTQFAYVVNSRERAQLLRPSRRCPKLIRTTPERSDSCAGKGRGEEEAKTKVEERGGGGGTRGGDRDRLRREETDRQCEM